MMIMGFQAFPNLEITLDIALCIQNLRWPPFGQGQTKLSSCFIK